MGYPTTEYECEAQSESATEIYSRLDNYYECFCVVCHLEWRQILVPKGLCPQCTGRVGFSRR